MVKTLMALLQQRSAALLELLGAGATVYGMSLLATWAAWLTVGALLMLKSLEVDLRSGDDS